MFAFYLKPIHYFKSFEFYSYLLQFLILYQKQLYSSLCFAILLFNNSYAKILGIIREKPTHL